MTRKRKKRKLKIGRILLAIFILLLLIGAIIFLWKGTKKIIIEKESKFLAGTTSIVELFIMDEEGNLQSSKELVRGTKVIDLNKKITYEEKEYREIEYEKNNYYVNSINLVKDEKKVVLEKNKFVRTSVTVYENETDSKIASFIKKGNEITKK